ncbi:MAG: hypothetical protein F6K17_03225 [Okeania sp. SIO3C4]|nr:hypothetical protein [Okeania sp. SIO3B3]NER01706.1 hypothetical protein [Okeania sp. SIO3C4]
MKEKVFRSRSYPDMILHFGGRKAAGVEAKKGLKGIKFFMTDPSEHDIKYFYPKYNAI